MNWLEIINLYLMMAVVSLSISLFFTYTHRRSPWSKTFFTMGIFIGFYLIGYVLEFNSSNLQSILLYNLIQYIGIPFFPLFWLYLGIQMNTQWPMNPRRWILFLSPGILVFLLRLSNQLHGWYYQSYQLVEVGGRSILLLDRGWGYLVHIVISTLALVFGNALVIRHILSVRKTFGSLLSLLLLATVIPWFAMIANLVGWPIEGLDVVILTLPISLTMMIFILLRFDLLSVDRLAVKQLFYLSYEGYLIEDITGYLIDANDAVKKLIYVPTVSLPRIKTSKLLSQLVDETLLNKEGFQVVVFQNDVYIDITKSPLIKQGTKVGSLYILKDVTELRRLSENLVVTQTKYNRLIESFEDVYFQSNLKGIILSISDSVYTVLGYTAQELINTDVNAHYENPKEREGFVRTLQSEKMVHDYRVKFRRKDGNVIECLLSANLIQDELGTGMIIYGTMKDISALTELKSQVASVEHTIHMTLSSVLDAICTFSLSQQIELANPTAQHLFGQEELKKLGYSAIPLYDESMNRYSFDTMIEKGAQKEQFEALIQIDGQKRDVIVTASLIQLEGKEVEGIVLVFKDISMIKEEQRRIEYLSLHDALTGCLNRRAFDDAMIHLDQVSYLPLALVVCDVNGLKLTNDAFGHHQGDELLRQSAEFLRKWVEIPEFLYRIGGDEFILFWPNTSDFMANERLEEMKLACKQVSLATGELSISFGSAVKNHRSLGLNTVFKQAEDRMYQQKIYESSDMKGNLIQTILDTLKQKNPSEFVHSERVASLSEEIAKVMGLSVFMVQEVKSAAFLHDIGKIGIDDQLLNHPGPLSEDELVEVRRHTEIGYRILSAHPQLKEVAKAVYSHHERYDGKGYPRGLSQEMIPMAARIIAVADAFDSMTERHQGKSIQSIQEAIDELYVHQGTQFDPVIVNALVSLVQEEK